MLAPGGWFNDSSDWDVQLLDVTLDPAAGPTRVHAAYDVIIAGFDVPITHFTFNGHPIIDGNYPVVVIYDGVLHVWWTVDGSFDAGDAYETSDGVPEITFENGHHLELETGVIGPAPTVTKLTRTGVSTYELMGTNLLQGIPTGSLPYLTTLNAEGSFFTLTGPGDDPGCWILTNPDDPPATIECSWNAADPGFCPAFEPTQTFFIEDPP